MKPDEKTGEKPAGSPGDGDDYDPYLHREVAHPTTNTETLIHMIKGCLGTGILAMPEAFKNAGLLNGAVCTVIIGFLCTYCLHILVKAQYVLCKRMQIPMLTYPQSMKKALESGPPVLKVFAKMSPYMIDFFLVVYQLGICCCYVVFVARNVRAVIDLARSTRIEYYVLASFLPFVLIVMIRNLKILAPFSIIANILTFISFGIMLYYIFVALPSIKGLPTFGKLYTFPLFFGTSLFAIEAVGVVISLENNMKTPKSFIGCFGVLNVSMTIIVFMYVGIGFMGYWRYGANIESSITLNFERTEILAKVVKLLYCVAIYISYSLQAYPSVQIVWETYMLKHLENSKHQLAWEYLLRILFVTITVALAAAIPRLGLFISLFGAFCLSALGLIFPAMMELCTHYPGQFGKLKIILVKDIFLIVFGLVGLVTGSYCAISEIVCTVKR